MQELDYAEMLEIPVNTVNVTKKKSFLKRKETRDDMKDRVVDSVNERVGAYVEAENLTDPPAKSARISFKRDRESIILISEIAAVFVLALTIFLTNIFMPTSAINTFIGSLRNSDKQVSEPTYSELKLSSVVGSYSDAEVVIADNGVLSVTTEGCVYPVCDGTVSSVEQLNGGYVVKINHTSTFSSVISGLTDVYSEVGATVKGNLPVGYSDGSGEVKVCLYDGETMLNNFTLNGEIPVWKS